MSSISEDYFEFLYIEIQSFKIKIWKLVHANLFWMFSKEFGNLKFEKFQFGNLFLKQ